MLPVVWSPIAVGERRMMISHRVRRNEIAECLSGINLCNLYSTGNLWSRKVDSKVHELDSSPHGVVILLLWKKWIESMSVLLKRFCGRESLAGFHHFYVVWEKWSGQNRISHWMKICDDHNSQIDLRSKQKYKVLSATSSFFSQSNNINNFQIVLFDSLMEL